MSGLSLPVARPSGKALVVASAAIRSEPLAQLHQLGCTTGEADDSYAAMAELCRQPAEYTSLILSLASLYKEELALIQSVKRRFPKLEIWLTQTEGRLSALAEAVRMGADGFLAEDGLHRVAAAPPPVAPSPRSPASAAAIAEPPPATLAIASPEEAPPTPEPADDLDFGSAEPVLTADELRALLQESPDLPTSRTD